MVYDLIPPGNSSEPAARLYVFHSPHDYKLPAQFATRPLANRNYRVWSVACQQDLVYVLVYEGDEKRIGNLIRIQQVG